MVICPLEKIWNSFYQIEKRAETEYKHVFFLILGFLKRDKNEDSLEKESLDLIDINCFAFRLKYEQWYILLFIYMTNAGSPVYWIHA